MQTRLDDFLVGGTLSKDAIPFTQYIEDLDIDGDEDDLLQEADLEQDSLEDDGEPNAPRRESMYVQMFDEVLETVLEGEEFLFAAEELRLFDRFKALSYPARYLLVRLILRKAQKWHRSDALNRNYHLDIPDLNAAIDELSKPFTPTQTPQVKDDGPEYIVIEDSDDEDDAKVCKPPPDPAGFFIQVDSDASIHEMLGCLKLPELRDLARKMKLKVVDSRHAAIVDLLLANAGKQTTLANYFSRAGQPKKGQTTRLRDMVKGITGPCIRVNCQIRRLVQRINLVFFRSTELSATLLPLILSRTKASNPSRRNYPVYLHSRTTTIFPSRAALLTYEGALELEKRMEDAFAAESRVEGAAQVLDLFKPAFARWKELLAELSDSESESAVLRAGALERFHEGHVLTRVVYKAAYACGVLKRHYEEEQIIRTLLSQRRWRKGRRGAWYDRLALILMNYKDKDNASLEEALQLVKEGLEDPDTHLIYRPALENRLLRIENKLKLPPEERYRSTLRLKKAKNNLITGRRIYSLPLAEVNPSDQNLPRPSPKAATKTSLSDKSTTTLAINLVRRGSLTTATAKAKEGSPAAKPRGKENKVASWKSTGKSVWKGQNGEVSVEELALEHYATLGYKGYHSEGRILMHIFTLLFWPVIFDDSIPGAFETRFQSCPLDLVHDTFFPVRQEAIMQRLKQIEGGMASEFINETDARERPRKTWAIGARWDDFPLEDVLNIVEGLGGNALSVICRLLAEEYSCRGSGVPDLIIWKENAKECMFVEVKGPGDQLRENQRVWIDVMVRNGIAVEVLRVENWDYKPRGKAAVKAIVLHDDSDSEVEEEEPADNSMDVEMGTSSTSKDAPLRTQARKRPIHEVDD
ncbi:hypothetical protein M407DRAFT_16703 [Tulasnella calospora MUT 4182]|uniref:Fanconi-associated nuclease n=1 Tax=Tulasnella calospora MUT 4182 TaxID=1051891 RepID=A0A0C3QXE5_9AGAM|nr:hypothetical protein M407DRAFT_16703 [Tulasnella calospora MUT 4182]